MSNSFKLYAARDTKTGKLVCDITSPGHKFWVRKGDCERAIWRYSRNPYKRKNYDLELVELLVTEVPKEICLES